MTGRLGDIAHADRLTAGACIVNGHMDDTFSDIPSWTYTAAGGDTVAATVETRIGAQTRTAATTGTEAVTTMTVALLQAIAAASSAARPATIRLGALQIQNLNPGSATSLIRAFAAMHDGNRSWAAVGLAADPLTAAWHAIFDAPLRLDPMQVSWRRWQHLA